jgi:heptosyltransferase-2
MSLPALEALGRFEKERPVWVIARTGAAAAYRHHHGVERVITEERSLKGRMKLASILRSQDFSRAFIFPNSFSSALTAFLGRVPDRLGYRRNLRSAILSKSLKMKPCDFYSHQSFHFLNLIEAAYGQAPFIRPKLAAPPLDPQLALPDGFKLALAPGAAYGGAKQWPAERFADSALLILSELKGTAVILGGPSEMAAAAKVEERLKNRVPLLNLAGRTNLDQAAAALAGCDLTLSNDSGLMHLSGALDVPVVAAFGPTNPLSTSPLARLWSIVRKPVECSPCLLRQCPKAQRICFDGVTPQLMAQEAFRLLSKPVKAAGALFWKPNQAHPRLLTNSPNLRLVVDRSDFLKLSSEPFKAPEGTIVLQQPLSASQMSDFWRNNGLNPSSSLWLSDDATFLKNSLQFGGKSALIMTERAISQIPDILHDDFLPSITVPDPARALEWFDGL